MFHVKGEPGPNIMQRYDSQGPDSSTVYNTLIITGGHDLSTQPPPCVYSESTAYNVFYKRIINCSSISNNVMYINYTFSIVKIK